MATYAQVIGEAAVATVAPTPATSTAPVSPSTSPQTQAIAPLKTMQEALKIDITKVKLPAILVGAGAGAYYYKKNRILGGLAGGGAADVAELLYRKNYKAAMVGAIHVGAAVGGSLYLFKGKRPVVGYLLGMVASNLATRAVNKEAHDEYMHSWGK